MVPAVLGDTETGWCMPCVPYAGPNVGIAFLPETGSGVWIEFEGGDVSYPVWVGGYWRDGEVPADVGATREGHRHDGAHPAQVRRRPGRTHHHRPQRQHGHPGRLGHHARQRGSRTVVVSDSSVSVNDSALEVQG